MERPESFTYPKPAHSLASRRRDAQSTAPDAQEVKQDAKNDEKVRQTAEANTLQNFG